MYEILNENLIIVCRQVNIFTKCIGESIVIVFETFNFLLFYLHDTYCKLGKVNSKIFLTEK